MKIPAGIFFLLLTGCLSFSKNLVLLEYAINKDFIASALCINKARPKLQCQGKCQIMKKMAAEEQPDNKPVLKNSVEQVLFQSAVQNMILIPIVPAKPVPQQPGAFDLSAGFPGYVFHPPSLS